MAEFVRRETLSDNIMQWIDTGARTAWMMKETPTSAAVSVTGNCPIWKIDLHGVAVADEGDATAEPTQVCEFKRGRLRVSRRTQAMSYTWRHIDADELLFVHRGDGTLLTEMGELDLMAGRFVFITRGTGYRVLPRSDDYMALIYESEEPLQLGRDVAAANLPITYPTMPYTAIEPNDAGQWEERLRTESWGLVAMRHFDPVLTGQVMTNTQPIFAMDVGDIPAHSPTAPNPSLPFIIVNNAFGHLEIAKRKENLPFYHRNVRANETLFVHAGSGDRDTDFGFRQAGPGTLNNFPKGIEHSIATRPMPCINLIWETTGDVDLNPDFLADAT